MVQHHKRLTCTDASKLYGCSVCPQKPTYVRLEAIIVVSGDLLSANKCAFQNPHHHHVMTAKLC